jgi:hypothetical protein
MLVLRGPGIMTLMRVVILVNLMDQPEKLKGHVRRGGQPEGHQHPRDDPSHEIHDPSMSTPLPRFKAGRGRNHAIMSRYSTFEFEIPERHPPQPNKNFAPRQ